MSNDKEVLEEIKLGLIAIRRDVIERLRRIEEYISFIDSDVGRLRLEIQRINEKLREISSEEEQYKLQKIEPVVKKVPKVEPIKTTPSTKRTTLNPTEIAIIKYLIENPSTKSATPIAQSIGKAREHVARTLKKLADEKIIIRDENTWPYTYIVPEETKKLVM